MFFPIGTDHDGRRPAITTVLLILVNIAMYVAMRTGFGAQWQDMSVGEGPIDAFVRRFWLNPRDFHWWHAGGFRVRPVVGISCIIQSRELFESHVRRKVRAGAGTVLPKYY